MKRIIYLGGYSGTGKLIADYTKVLTTEGFKSAKDITMDDTLIGDDGLPTKLLGIFPEPEPMMYRVFFSDKTHIDCCSEHLWEIQTTKHRKKGTSCVRTTDQISTLLERGEEPSVKLCKPVRFDEKVLPIEPYLLGNLIADGYFTNKKAELVTGVDSQFFIDKYNYIAEIYTPQNNVTIIYFPNETTNIGGYLQDLDLLVGSSDRFIPEIYKLASIEQRTSLLQGLMDCDGKVSRNGGLYSTTSKQLAFDVMELARSLGCYAYLTTKDMTSSGMSIEYFVYIRQPKTIALFQLPRKINSEVWTDDVTHDVKFITKIHRINSTPGRCFSVDNESKLYLIENYTVTHNTTYACPILEDMGYTKISTSDALHNTVQGVLSIITGLNIDTYNRTDNFLSIKGIDSLGNQSVKFWKNGDFRQLNIDIAESCLVPIYGREIMALYIAKKAQNILENGCSVLIETVGGEEYQKAEMFCDIIIPDYKSYHKQYINLRRTGEGEGIDLRKLLPNAIDIWNEGDMEDLKAMLEVAVNG